MQGRWEVLLTKGGTLKGAQHTKTMVHGDGWQVVPVVPCDDAAIERAMQAIIDSDDIIPHGEEPERVGWALALAERALRAAGETP